MDTLKARIVANTYTLTTLYHRIAVLQQILEQVYFTTDDSATYADRYSAAVAALEETDRVALEEWETDWLTHFSEDNVHHELSALREWAGSLPRMTIYVPVAFDAPAAAVVGQWCRAEIDESLMLEILVDPAVVGGCGVIREYTYHDLSLRAKLAADPTAIKEVLQSYE